METIYRGVDKKEMKKYAFDLMNLLNATFMVSNNGREFRFNSCKDGSEVTLYTTTGGWMNKRKFFANDAKYDEESIKECIKKCIKYHVNENV